jgi:hypothetical protein
MIFCETCTVHDLSLLVDSLYLPSPLRLLSAEVALKKPPSLQQRSFPFGDAFRDSQAR